MNFAPPKWIVQAAEEALNTVASNHYSHPKGRIRLREALKSFYSPRFYRELDVESEILVTSGANEGLSSLGDIDTKNHIFYRTILRFRCLPRAR